MPCVQLASLPCVAGDLLSKWKVQISLQETLDGITDGRSVSGARKAMHRALASKEVNKQVEGALLRNYVKLLETAQVLCEPKHVAVLPMPELEEMLASMAEEEMVLPLALRKGLLRRRCKDVICRHEWSSLMRMINPFEEGEEFEWKEPRVRDFNCSEKERLQTFTSILLNSVVMPCIQGGAECVPDLQEAIQAALVMLNDVDIVEVSALKASVHSKTCCACNALVALMKQSFMLCYKDTHGVT